MTLKSVTAAPSGVYSNLNENWNRPLPDGQALDDVYAWEERRITAMREGLAEPFSYVWVPARSISLSRREAARLNLEGFTAEPLAIRGTGGTAVPQGPGTANITLFTRHSAAPDITAFYHEMCAALSKGFAALNIKTEIGAKPGSFCDGDFNLLHDGRKLAGTAQRWCRAKNGNTLGCHHVVILTGGNPTDLCGRLETLYQYSGEPEPYTPSAHCSERIDIEALRSAMLQPLSNLVHNRA